MALAANGGRGEDEPAEPVSDKAKIESIKNHLIARWDAQDSEVVTAKIRFRRFSHGGTGEFKPLDAAKVRELFLSFRLTEDDEQLKSLVNSLLQAPHWAERPWSDGTFSMEGEKTRDEIGSYVEVFDGETALHRDDANRSVILGQRPGPPRYRYEIRDFRFVVPKYLRKKMHTVLRRDPNSPLKIPSHPPPAAVGSLESCRGSFAAEWVGQV